MQDWRQAKIFANECIAYRPGSGPLRHVMRRRWYVWCWATSRHCADIVNVSSLTQLRRGRVAEARPDHPISGDWQSDGL